MIYKVSLMYWNRPITSKFTIQTFWVDIDVSSDDSKLKDKIMFGMEYNGYRTLYDNVGERFKEVQVDIVPFPEYPDNAESDLLDLNNTLQAYEKCAGDKFSFEKFSKICHNLQRAVSLIYDSCNLKSEQCKYLSKLAQRVSIIKSEISKIYNGKNEKLIREMNSAKIEKHIKAGLEKGYIQKVLGDKEEYFNAYGDRWAKDEDGFWIRISWGF